MVGKVSTNLIPFKTPDFNYRTSRVHFKTFDDWVKARKMKCDMVLKDVSSFISEKNRGGPTRSNRCTDDILPPATDSPTAGGPRVTVTPRHPEHPPQTEEIPPWETTTTEESSPWNVVDCPLSYRGERWQAMAREGKIQSKSIVVAPHLTMFECQRGQKAQKWQTPFKTPGQKKRKKVTFRDTNHAVADRATK